MALNRSWTVSKDNPNQKKIAPKITFSTFSSQLKSLYFRSK
jgi:hypothetical protein